MEHLAQFYFHWMDSMGGWLIILVVCMLATVWLYNDSETRILPANTWRAAITLPFLLFLPTVIGTLAALKSQVAIDVHRFEYQFCAVLGLAMLLMTLVIVFSYALTFRGLVGSEDGSGLYNASQPNPYTTRSQMEKLGLNEVQHLLTSVPRSYSGAVLVDVQTGNQYPVYTGITRIGRARASEIRLPNRTVSRRHGMIWETNNQFVLHCYAPAVILVNQKRMGKTHIMRVGEEFQLGSTRLRFLANSNKSQAAERL